MSIAGQTTDSARTAYRFVTGAHLDGLRRTDAGAFRRGTRPVVPGGRVTRWSLLSRAERAGVRLGSLAGAGGLGWGLLEHPHGTGQALQAAAAGLSVAAGHNVTEWVREARHLREWVRPLHVALEGPLGLPEGTAPRSYLHIPRDYPAREDVGRIDLPVTFTGVNGGSAMIRDIVRVKLGLSDASVSFKLEGRRPHLAIRQTPRPPARVTVQEEAVRQLVTEAPESAPLIGIGPQGIRVAVDLDAESPHILVSASTGGGKSVITRDMTCQMLHNGARAEILDFKRHSHKWARGLPNVAYHRDIEDIHEALVSLGAEGHRRNYIVDEWEGDDREAPVGPRLVVLLEEANATIAKLKRYWSGIRTKEDPKESPAIDALREILFMGRAVRMHVLLVAQSATAAALGGPEVRECFATRILARYTRNAWMMLVPEVQPIPRSTRHIGRAQVVLGGVAHETQVCFWTDSEAREWAASGTVAEPAEPTSAPASVPVSQGHTGGVHLEKEPGTVPGRHLRAVPSQGRAEAPVGLKEAVEAGILAVSLDSARAARKRDPEFPEPVARRGQEMLYDPDSLRRWERNRPRAAESTA